MTSINIPNSVTSIGRDAFRGCSSLTSINLNCTYIDSWLRGNTSIKEIVLGESVTSIGSDAFYGCSSLISINIPNSVTSIGSGAFWGCSGLTSINIPNSVTSIGSYVFNGCTNLQTITSYLKKPLHLYSPVFMSETLSSATLHVPFGRSKAYKAAGWNFETIEEMEGIGDEIIFIQFADATTKEVCVKWWDENEDGEISLEEAKNITDIRSYFSRNTSITSFDELKYFTNITTIDNEAFSRCSSLKSITLPEGITTIGNGAFYGCSSLKSITLPEGITTIGNSAFENCSSLKSITLPEGITTIGSRTFIGSRLTEMTLPSTLTSIGEYALAGNVIHCQLTTPISVGTLISNASEVVLYVPQGCEQAFRQAYGWKDFLFVETDGESIDWTTGVVSIHVEQPGGLRLAIIEHDEEDISRLKISGQLNSSDLQYLMEGRGKIESLESIDLSEVTLNYDGGCYYSKPWYGITDMGFGGGRREYYLTEYEYSYTEYRMMEGFGGTTYYYTYSPNLAGVFSGKPYRHIVMPVSVKKAAHEVFGGCRELQSVVFPSGISKIDAGAFQGCEKIQSISVQGIDSIADHAFSGCMRLQNVEHIRDVKYIGQSAFKNCYMLTGDNGILSLPLVDSIADSTFSHCSMLHDIRFSENLKHIGKYAFAECNTLSAVTLPNNLSSLAIGAFQDCKTLEQVTFSPTLMRMDYSSFMNTPWQESLPSENGIQYMGHIAVCYDKEAKSPATLAFREGTTYIADRFIQSGAGNIYNNQIQNITSIEFPASLVKIGDYAFSSNLLPITTIVLPENLETIGNGAFYGLQKLAKVTLTEKIRELGDETFANSTGLTTINYNAIKATGSNLFNKCTSLEKVNIGAKVQLLPDGIFADCTNLTIVKFAEHDEATPLIVGHNAFRGCYNMYNIKLPDNTESIGDAAFKGCSGLTEFTVPQRVNVVSGEMLSECRGLTAVQLHEGITIIGDYAFRECNKVTSFSLPEGLDSIGCQAFEGCYALRELTIPASVTRLGKDFLQNCYQLTKLATKIREPHELSSIIPMSGYILQNVYNFYGNQLFNYDVHYDEMTLVVPDGCKSRYMNTDGWNKFTHIEEESGGDFIAAHKFYVSENVVPKGGTTRMGINLVNDAVDLAVYQFDLVLPLEFGIMNSENGEYEVVKGVRYENDSHSITVEKLSDLQSTPANKYRIVCQSTSNALITGNDGQLLNVHLYVNENSEEGNYAATLENVVVSKSDGTQYELDDVPFNIIVTSVLAQSVTLSSDSWSGKIGESFTLAATVLPENTTNKNVTWSSSDESIATVDAEGKVTMNRVGEAVITARATDGSGVSATCLVTVNPILAESLTLSATEWNGKVGDLFTLVATVLPENVTDKNITWSSSDRNIAMVDADGNVVARAVGEATITASCGNVTAICTVTVVATPAESITLNLNTARLKVGKSVHLTATVYPAATTNKTISWSSSNSEIATVDADGNVTAVSIGEATITASCGNVTAICTVTVVATPAESVTLSQTTAQLNMGESIHQTATVYPETTTDKTVNWSSSNSEIATVDADGNVTAVSVGEATITATAADGTGVSASCHVTVLPVLAESLTVTPESWDGMEGDSFTLVATVFPENATDKSVSWSSSDSEIATVDAEGNVRVLKDGYCTITVSTQDGSNLSAECVITSVSGIDAIFKDANASFDIYNLQGIQIKESCRRGDLRKLPTGAYILRQGNVRKKIMIR